MKRRLRQHRFPVMYTIQKAGEKKYEADKGF